MGKKTKETACPNCSSKCWKGMRIISTYKCMDCGERWTPTIDDAVEPLKKENAALRESHFLLEQLYWSLSAEERNNLPGNGLMREQIETQINRFKERHGG